MKLGNLACGAVRPQGEEWWNVDSLHSVLADGTPERKQLDSEPRYIEANLETEGVPFEDGSMDGLLLSHALEHWDAPTGARILGRAYTALKQGGLMIVSVPDAGYFRAHYEEDTIENAERIFGEPIFLADGEPTFTGYGLWCPGRHKAILSEDSVWHYFKRAGFGHVSRVRIDAEAKKTPDKKWWACHRRVGDFEPALLAMCLMVDHLNRLQFSLVMCAVKE